MDSILELTKADLDGLKEKYGNAFYLSYKREAEKRMEHQKLMTKLLREKPQDVRPYGSLLDKYIK